MTSTLKWWCRALLCGVLLHSGVANARTPLEAAKRAAQQVNAIDADVAGRPPLRERPLQGFAAEGARVVAWGTPKSVSKISVEGLGERGRVLQDFYWQRGALLAVHARRLDYGASISELPKDKPAPTTLAEDEWLEFAGDRLLRRRTLDGVQPLGEAATRRRGAELRAAARSFKRLMSTADAAGKPGGACTWACAGERRGECLRYQCE